MNRLLCSMFLLAVSSASFPAAAGDSPESDARVALGRRLFFDARLSDPPGTSCASCHDPTRAFSGDNGSGLGVARGSRPGALGTRKTPTAMYLGSAPPPGVLQRDGQALHVGGLFWDGRAATLEAQARGPIFTAHEMGNADPARFAQRVAASNLGAALQALWGPDVTADPERLIGAVTASLAAFERSAELQPFTSKFDAVKRGTARFSEQEQRGFGLFTIRQKGNCAACHQVDVDAPDPRRSLFTDFTYHTVSVPRNTRLPHNATPTAFDLGRCGPVRTDVSDRAQCGMFRTPTLRNVALTAPYMHNARFATLREVVAFYATRDTDPDRWYGAGRRFDDLPADLHGNVDQQTPPYNRAGKRAQLKDDEIDDIVAFLNTLTDGWTPSH